MGGTAAVGIPVTTAAATGAGIAQAFAATAGNLSQVILAGVASIPGTVYPTVDPEPIRDILAEYADAYKRQAESRVRQGVAEALRLPTRAAAVRAATTALAAALKADPPDRTAIRAANAALRRARDGEGTREAAIQRVMAAEKRYAALHARAQVARSHGAADQARLEQTSPEGALWEVDPSLNNEHYCLRLNGRVWPHSLLRRVRPPVHVGCGCRLIGKSEVIQRGLPWEPVPAAEVERELRHQLGHAEPQKIAVMAAVAELAWRGALQDSYREELHPRDPLGHWVRGLGFPAFKVGGAVRDPLLGSQPNDIDFLLQTHPDNIAAAVKRAGGRADPLTVRGRLVGIRAHMKGITPPEGVELAPPRVEQSTGPGRHDFEILPHPAPESAAAIYRDAIRRDFTVNAMYENAETGEIIDPLGGRADLQAGLLRTTTPDSFRDDPLRILRGLRFMSTLGFDLAPETEQQMRDHASAVTALTRKGVSGTARKELNKLLMGDRVGKALRMMRDTGVMGEFLPELRPMIGYDQENPHHDLPLDEHVLRVVEGVARLRSPLHVRLAALFHDSGKPASAWRSEDGRLHYYGSRKVNAEGEVKIGPPDARAHEDVGAEIARGALTRLGYDTKTVNLTERVIQHHMVPMGITNPKAVRKWRAKVGTDIENDVLNHRTADFLAKDDPGTGPFDIERFATAVRREREAKAPTVRADLAVNGRDLMAMGVQPGPQMGVILKALQKLAVEDPSLNTREWLLARVEQGNLTEAFNPDQARGPDGQWIKGGGLAPQLLGQAGMYARLRKMTGGKMHPTLHELVAQKGTAYRPQPLPADKEHLRGPVGGCYKNVTDVVLGFDGHTPEPGLTYVEGYALSAQIPLPIHHAWAVDGDGNVLELTWPEPGAEYLGIPMSKETLFKAAAETGVYGVLGNGVDHLVETIEPSVTVGKTVLIWDPGPEIGLVERIVGNDAHVRVANREVIVPAARCQLAEAESAQVPEAAFEAAGVMARAVLLPLEEGLVDFAQRELELAGLFSKDSDYDGMLGRSVMKLVRAFAGQGHSGFSAMLALDLFKKLAGYKPLTALTDDPTEWMQVDGPDASEPYAEDHADRPRLWQSRRRPDAFSLDGGRTYYCLDDPENWEEYTDPEDGEKGRRWIQVPGQHAKLMHKSVKKSVQEGAWDSSQMMLHPRGAGGKFRDTVDKLGFSLNPGNLKPPKALPSGQVPPHHHPDLPAELRGMPGKTIFGHSLPAKVRAATEKDADVTKRLGPGYTAFVPEEGERNGMIGVGVDKKGRVKRVYSDEFQAGKAKAKFERVARLTEVLPAADARMRADASESEAALAALLIRTTGMRPGSTSDRGGDADAFGATTLEARHVVSQGDGTVRLQFTGKNGKANDIHVPDPALSSLLLDNATAKSPSAQLIETRPEHVNAYLKEVLGKDFTAKDLRTALGTATAVDALDRLEPPPPPQDEKEARDLRARVAAEVADRLGNTPAVALDRYIDPAVFGGWPVGGVVKEEFDELLHPRGRGGVFRAKNDRLGFSLSRTEPIIDVGSDVRRAADLLAEGKRVRLDQPRTASTLLSELARRVQEAKALGKDAPLYDLCKVTVRGTDLFCAESKGIPRVKMPQLSGRPIPGSRADAEPKNAAGSVNLGDRFRDHMAAKGVRISDETERASWLKASQITLNGGVVAGMVKTLEAGRPIGGQPRIFISREGYVVDGHHRWAAMVGHGLGQREEMMMDIARVDTDIITLLEEANRFAAEWGIGPKEVTPA